MSVFPARAPPLCKCFCRTNLATRFVRNCCRRSTVRRISYQRVGAHMNILTYRNVSPAGLLALPHLIIFDAVDQALDVGMPLFKRSGFLRKPRPCESVFGACTECACCRSVDCVRHQHVNKLSVPCRPVVEKVYGWQRTVCSPLFVAGRIVVFFTGFRRDLIAGHAVSSDCAYFTVSEIEASLQGALETVRHLSQHPESESSLHGPRLR